jgi:hypothetical protein
MNSSIIANLDSEYDSLFMFCVSFSERYSPI